MAHTAFQLKNYFQSHGGHLGRRFSLFFYLYHKRHKNIKKTSFNLPFFVYYNFMQSTLREVIQEQIPPRILIPILLLVALFSGYALFTTTDTGTLVVDSPIYGAQLFVDRHAAGVLRELPDTMRLAESSGKHNVIVAKDGYWPWTTDFEIKKHETVTLHPFLIPQRVPMESIPRFLNDAAKTNPDYEHVLSLFADLKMSDEIERLAEATRIQNITFADYAPGRTDVLLIATPDGIFAIGIEKNEHPNFQPVYKGENPLFMKTTDSTLYIKDGDSIFRVKNFGK